MRPKFLEYPPPAKSSIPLVLAVDCSPEGWQYAGMSLHDQRPHVDAQLSGSASDEVRTYLTPDYLEKTTMVVDLSSMTTKRFYADGDGGCLFYAAARKNDKELGLQMRIACLRMVSAKRDVPLGNGGASLRRSFHFNSQTQSCQDFECYDMESDLQSLSEPDAWAHSGFYRPLAALLLRPIWVFDEHRKDTLGRLAVYDVEGALEHEKFHLPGCECRRSSSPIIIRHEPTHFSGIVGCVIYFSDGCVYVYEDGKDLRRHPDGVEDAKKVAARMADESPGCFWPGTKLDGTALVNEAKRQLADSESAAAAAAPAVNGKALEAPAAAPADSTEEDLGAEKLGEAADPAAGAAAKLDPGRAGGVREAVTSETTPAPADSTEEDLGADDKLGEPANSDAADAAAGIVHANPRGDNLTVNNPPAVCANVANNGAEKQEASRRLRARPEEEIQGVLERAGLELSVVVPNPAVTNPWFRRHAASELCVPPSTTRSVHRPIRAYRQDKHPAVMGCVEVVDRLYSSPLRRALEPGVFVGLRDGASTRAGENSMVVDGIIVACAMRSSFRTEVFAERCCPSAFVVVVQKLGATAEQLVVSPSDITKCEFRTVVDPLKFPVWQKWSLAARGVLGSLQRVAPPSALHTPSPVDVEDRESPPRTPAPGCVCGHRVRVRVVPWPC